MYFIRNPDTARRVRLVISILVSYFASFFVFQFFFLNGSPDLNPNAFATMGEQVTSAKKDFLDWLSENPSGNNQAPVSQNTGITPTVPPSVPDANRITAPVQPPSVTPVPTSVSVTVSPTAAVPSPTSWPTIVPTQAVPTAKPTSSRVTYAQFGQCLNSKSMVMYMSATCGLCAQQKKTLKDAYNYIRAVDCNASQQNGLECSQVGVRGLPTWAKNGKAVLSGPQTNETLADEAGCQAPNQ